MFLEQRFRRKSYGLRDSTEGSHNGIAAVLKTVGFRRIRSEKGVLSESVNRNVNRAFSKVNYSGGVKVQLLLPLGKHLNYLCCCVRRN